ncbi:polymeric immunoglobulin receptor-like [Clupea harengus]|uniref:polymeric immunoglobulin receptor-like n=1 Tax=Clupea harengus TaxID=7950 RepID=UPI0012AB4154|nr:polymeric immunoglobulin receptor-like [Clupea harengus]
MKVLLTLTILLSVPGEISGKEEKKETIKLIGFSGGGVIVKCSYKDKYKQKEKSVCKGDDRKCMFNKLSRATEQQVTLHDTNNNYFLVLMTKLTPQDSGMYQCLVEEDQDKYINTPFSLEVKQEPCCGHSITKTGYVGDSIVITCKYPDNKKGNIKYFYKQHNVTIFNLETSTDSQHQNLPITDDRDSNEFSVTLRKLTKADAGVYWCGVGTGADTGSSNLINEVKLNVCDQKGSNCQPPSIITPSARPPSTQVLPDQTSTPPLGSNTVTAVCVTLAVLVTGLVGVLLYVCKNRKTQGNTTPTGYTQRPQADTSCSSDPGPACPNYATVTFQKKPEKVKDVSSAVTPGEETTSDYATIQHH